MEISCSNCGKRKKFRYSASNILCTVYNQGWSSYGSALYCPECSKTWNGRNPGRPLARPESTVNLIDEWYHCHKP